MSAKEKRSERNVDGLENEIARKTTIGRPGVGLELDRGIGPGIDHGIVTEIAIEIAIETVTQIAPEIVAVVEIVESDDGVIGRLETNEIAVGLKSSRSNLPRKTTRDSKEKHSKTFYGRVKEVLLNNPSPRSTRPLCHLLEELNLLLPYSLYVETLSRIRI